MEPRTSETARERENRSTGATPGHVTYLDCITGKAPVPTEGIEQFAFRVLMAGGMVTFMVNFNGILHYGGLGFYPHGLWMLPLVFCIALLVRFGFANRLTGWAIGKLGIPQLSGARKPLGITTVNVCTMAPLMGSIVTLLLNGPAGFWGKIALALPVSFTAAFLANFLIVGPLVKMVVNNVLPKHNVFLLYLRAQKTATDVAYMLND